jgi:NTP pyrophosphatase (non-canonical NTP hydrolase)
MGEESCSEDYEELADVLWFISTFINTMRVEMCTYIISKCILYILWS